MVKVDPRYFRPTEVDILIGDASKARAKLGWKHRVSFDALVTEMVEEDRKSLRGDARSAIEEYHKSMTAPLLFDLRGKRVYVAGHTGLAGSAIMRRLRSEGCEILAADHKTLDLANQDQTEKWVMQTRPDAVFVAAARVGGIYANDTFPVDFLADNLAIALNVMRAALATGVKKLMFLGSSCVFRVMRRNR